ncbi:MAG: hypothetical protein HZA89_14750 [Verrucomicrobia bacterium]|nr:hypothetical protein [Verrucomicrobiota bacterium]
MKKDIAIEEIRAVRHQMSAECGHDINRYFAMLREEEKQFQEQIQRGKELTARLKLEREKYPEKTDDSPVLRAKPKS